MFTKQSLTGGQTNDPSSRSQALKELFEPTKHPSRALNLYYRELQRNHWTVRAGYFSALNGFVIIIQGIKTQELVEQWPYYLYILVENEKLGIKSKFELPSPCGVELRRPKRQMFQIVIQGCY